MIYDLTQLVNEELEPFDPSTEPHLEWKHCVDHSFFKCQVSKFGMVTHYGTHIDAPLHYVPGGKTTAQIDLACYCGKALCLDISELAKGDSINLTGVLAENQERIEPGMLLILRTGWEEKANTRSFFQFPDLEANTGALLESYGIRGIGVDMPSVDGNGEAHRSILSREIGIYESLYNLKPLVGRTFFFSAVPLKFEDGDGSPVRAYAITGDESEGQA